MSHIPHDSSVPRVLLSTASPYKFPRVVCQALGLNVEGLDDFDCMELLENTTSTKAPKMLSDLKNKTARFNDVINVEDMPDYVLKCANQIC